MDTHALSCGGNGNEALFSIAIAPGDMLDIGMTANSYDSRHETRWGGDCPGINIVTCTDDPDTARHSWTNDQTTDQNVYFAIDAYSSGAGAFTLSWTVGSPPPNACAVAVDLSTSVSPLQATTVGADNTHATSCGGNGNEVIFTIALQAGGILDIGMDSNGYDSRHETRWGGVCPGDNVVTCTDDPDTRRHRWTNDQAAAQPVYFIVDAYSSGAGIVQLSWTFPVPPTQNSTALIHLGGSGCTVTAQCFQCTGDCDDDGDCQAGLLW